MYRVRTPGGKLTYQYVSKKRAGPSCGDCGGKLQGVRFSFSSAALDPTHIAVSDRPMCSAVVFRCNMLHRIARFIAVAARPIDFDQSDEPLSPRLSTYWIG